MPPVLFHVERLPVQTISWNMSMPAQFAGHKMPAPFSDYEIGAAYDEMFRAAGRPRPHYKNLYTQLLNLPSEELYRCKKEADLSFFNQGITFTVYGRAEGRSEERRVGKECRSRWSPYH